MNKDTPKQKKTPTTQRDIEAREQSKEFTQSVEDAIEQNRVALEIAEEEYNRRYLGVGLMFIAALKANEPHLAKYGAQEAFDIVTPQLQKITGKRDVESAWYSAVGRVDNCGNDDDPIEFWFTYWDEVAPYLDPLQMAQRDIEEYPDLYALNLPPYRKGYAKFVQLVEAVGRRIKSPRVFIGRERWARELGVSKVMVTKYRRYAVKTGLLRVVAAGDRSKGLATTYEIDTDVLASLKGKKGPRELK